MKLGGSDVAAYLGDKSLVNQYLGATPILGGGVVPPQGFLFLIDNDGAYLTDWDGAYLLEAA